MAAILSSADLSIGQRWFVRPADPDTDTALAPFAPDGEAVERVDDPGLKLRHEGAHVAPAPVEIGA